MKCSYHSYFTEEETKAEILNNVSALSQLESGRASGTRSPAIHHDVIVEVEYVGAEGISERKEEEKKWEREDGILQNAHILASL